LEPHRFSAENNKLTASLKPNRKVLAKTYQEQIELLYDQIDQRTSNSKTLDMLKELTKTTLGLKEDIGAKDNFLEIGGDSLSAVNLASQLNTKFNAKIPVEVLATQNIQEIAKYPFIVLFLVEASIE
jgi:acyl carrier protein